jgi:hypothetical protein
MAVIAVVAVLFLWAPWTSKAPAAPTNIEASATAASVTLQWGPGEGGADVDRYVILRNGTEVGSVDGTSMTYTDKRLSPATEYEYQIGAVAGTAGADPTAPLAVTTLAPSPVDLSADRAEVGSITIRWAPPPDSPQPDRYVILRDGVRVGTVLGGTTVFEDTSAADGTSHTYRVAAMWNGKLSEPSSKVKGSSLAFAAPLQGSWTVTLRNTRTPGGSIEVGDFTREPWAFTPTCTGKDCAVVVKGTVLGESFKATLDRQGSVYSGSTTARVMTCGTGPIASAKVSNTLTFRLTAGQKSDTGIWKSWKGQLTMDSPYTESGDGLRYCPAQTHVFSVTAR